MDAAVVEPARVRLTASRLGAGTGVAPVRAKKSRCARGVKPGTPAGIRNVIAA